MKRMVVLLIMVAAAALAFGMGRKAPPASGAVAVVDTTLASQGISGKVEIWEGNFMPMIAPSKAGGKITPGAGLRVRIYEPVKIAGGMASAHRDSISTSLIGEAVCDSSGHFFLPVAPGTYSVFVERNGGWYSNSWTGAGVQGAVTVDSGKTGEILIKITDKATF